MCRSLISFDPHLSHIAPGNIGTCSHSDHGNVQGSIPLVSKLLVGNLHSISHAWNTQQFLVEASKITGAVSSFYGNVLREKGSVS